MWMVVSTLLKTLEIEQGWRETQVAAEAVLLQLRSSRNVDHSEKLSAQPSRPTTPFAIELVLGDARLDLDKKKRRVEDQSDREPERPRTEAAKD